MKEPVRGVASASARHVPSLPASFGSSACVSHTLALLMTPLRARITSVRLPDLASSRTPIALPPALQPL